MAVAGWCCSLGFESSSIVIRNGGVLFSGRSVELVSFSKLPLESRRGMVVEIRLFCSDFIDGRAFSVTGYSLVPCRISGSGL